MVVGWEEKNHFRTDFRSIWKYMSIMGSRVVLELFLRLLFLIRLTISNTLLIQVIVYWCFNKIFTYCRRLCRAFPFFKVIITGFKSSKPLWVNHFTYSTFAISSTYLLDACEAFLPLREKKGITLLICFHIRRRIHLTKITHHKQTFPWIYSKYNLSQ